MREWNSIVPAAAEDYYLVVNRYGRYGVRRTDLDLANYETAIADLITGQHCDPLRVITFSPETDGSEDVWCAAAQEILRRRRVPSVLEDFIDRHVGPDRQLTLRLAVV